MRNPDTRHYNIRIRIIRFLDSDDKSLTLPDHLARVIGLHPIYTNRLIDKYKNTYLIDITLQAKK